MCDVSPLWGGGGGEPGGAGSYISLTTTVPSKTNRFDICKLMVFFVKKFPGVEWLLAKVMDTSKKNRPALFKRIINHHHPLIRRPLAKGERA